MEKWIDKGIKNNTLESFEIKTTKGQTARVVICNETNNIKLIVDHKILAKLPQDNEFNPVVNVQGFYND